MTPAVLDVAEVAEMAVSLSLTLWPTGVTVAEADTDDAPSFIFWPAETVLDDAETVADDSRTRVAAGVMVAVDAIVDPVVRIRVATGVIVAVPAMVEPLVRTRNAAGETDAAAAIVRSPNLTRTQLTATEDTPGPKLAPSSRSAVEYAA